MVAKHNRNHFCHTCIQASTPNQDPKINKNKLFILDGARVSLNWLILNLNSLPFTF
jgi:hypothetical protein